MRNAYRDLARKPEWKRPPGRPRTRSEDMKQMHLKEI
jgi:hypothetical protein